MQWLVVIAVQWMEVMDSLMDLTSAVGWLLVTAIESVLGYCFVVVEIHY